MEGPDLVLLELLRVLKQGGYSFVTPTPDTHRKVTGWPHRRPTSDLRGVFGWSLPFREGDLDAAVVDLMARGGVLERRGNRLSSRVRVASLGDNLFLHSAFPPKAEDAVFFGPDSYRFADLIAAEAPDTSPGLVVDIGAGSGVGGIVAGRLWPKARTMLADVNRNALRLAGVNAASAGVEVELVESDGLAAIDGPIDLALANPPYIGGSPGRIYRDGGDMLGGKVSLDWGLAAARRLAPGGRLILYTGSAIVDGQDGLRAALEQGLAAEGCQVAYRELDPDVFGGTLLHPAYWRVERIAAVACIATKPV
jgi:uncharacterized protein YjeT (DUF2065 family)